MKKITVVTTFTEDLWNSYASRSIPTWFKNFDDSVEFHFHTDTFKPLKLQNIKYFQDSESKKDFLNRNHQLTRSLPKNVPSVGRRWWQYCHKVFSQYESSLNIDRGYMIFLDADVAMLDRFGFNEIEKFLENNFCGYIGRDSLLTETGLIIYDLDYPDGKDFLRNLNEIYTKDKLFELHSWCDCSAFDYSRINSKLPFINLSGNYSQYPDPISVGPIGQYFDHWMGKLSKKRGYSKHRKLRGKV